MSKPIQSLTGTVQKRNQVGGSIAISMLHGKSAYEIAVANGFVGTEEEWLESLKGDTATIELGTVTYGVPTSITNSGDETHAVFDFVLPTGDNASSEVAGVMKLYDNPGYNKDGSMTQAAMTTMLGNKVDKVVGKGLSTNDYTTEEKTKLANIEANADVNIIESVKVNGTALAPDVNKAVDITVPTKTSEITNDSNFAVDENYVHTDNNYTTTEKNKLNAIEANADVNVIETVKVNGTALKADANKAVDVTVPTKTSDITNDSGFITINDVVKPTTTSPLMDGTAAVGTESTFARGDHRHPSDSTKVDKVEGKGLSTNDFTDAEKNKVDGIGAAIQTGALAGLTVLTIPNNDGENLDEYYLVNSDGMQGVSNLLAQKAPLDSPALTGTPTAPTATVGTNTDQIATTKFVTSAVSTAIGNLAGVEFSIVNSLPATGDASIIYLVSASDGSGDDIYDEYIWLSANNKFEKIGTTRIDLSNYYNTSNMTPITSAQIDAICV